MKKIDFYPAKWIWTSDNRTKDQKVIFRKSFTAGPVSENAWLYFSCETKCWLWINGKMAVFEGGVFRESVKGSGYAEMIDIAPYLQPGENVLAALVWFYGNGGRNNTDPGEAGFILKCDELGLYSDNSFFAMPHPAYVPTGAPYPSYLYGGHNTGFDANRDPGDFAAAGYDDPALRPAAEYENKVWGDCILSELPPIAVYQKEELLLTPSASGAAAKLPYAMNFTVSFEAEALGGETIDIRTDRYTVNGGPGDEANTYRGHRIEYKCRPGANSFECLMYLYGEEVLVSFPETVKLKKLCYRETGYRTKRVGRFVTDDPLFNRLIEKSARTLYVCMRNNFMDCPDRERGQWIGDVSVQAPQVFFVFDENAQKLVKKSIRDFIYLRKGAVLAGNVPGECSQELPGQSLTAISGFGLIGEYWHYSHDPEIPEMVLEPAVRYLMLWEQDENGLLIPRKGDWRWFDHGENVDGDVIENCLYVAAAKFALKMAAVCGKHEYDEFLSKRVEAVTKAVEKKFWNGEYYSSGSFADDRANAAAVLSGICPPARYEKIRSVLLSVFNSTPYFERFVLTALCEMGFVHDAHHRMMSRYHDLACNENSTLWEDFHILGSRNHAWSGCPLEIAYKYFLGLRTDDAFRSYSISPVPGLFKQIKCSFRAGGEVVKKTIP